MAKLDMKDRRILHELDIDSRQANSEIAGKVGLSKQVVGLRIDRLFKNGVISWPYTVIDISKLGFTAHKNFVRLQNLDSAKESEMIDYLRKHPNIVWLASMDGRFDFCFSLWAENVEHLDKSLKEINRRYGQFIYERQIATIIQGTYFIRDYLIEPKKSNYRKSFFGAVPAMASLDATDWKILVQIANNSRKSAVAIAALSGVSPDTVAFRIKKMEKAGVIRHYNIVPNESAYPYQHYKILIGLKNLSEEKEREINEYCLTQQNITYIVKALGSWDLEIDIEVEGPDRLREILMRLKTRFSEIIKDYSTLHIYQVHKYNFCPSIQI